MMKSINHKLRITRRPGPSRTIFAAIVAVALAGGLVNQAQAQTINFSPEPPHDIPGGPAARGTLTQEDFATFAWQQFIALCWQSTYFPKEGVFQRGEPDTNAKVGVVGENRSAVWETYAHRTELRPWNVDTGSSGPGGAPIDVFNSAPSYQLGIGELGAKILSGAPNANYTLLNHLDEDNEIGSCDVFLSSGSSTGNLVLYQAKSNADEFNYFLNTFKTNQWYNWNPKGVSPPPPAGAPAPLYDAINNSTAAYQKTKAPPTSGPYINLPMGINGSGNPEGAIEIKTAFHLITEENQANFPADEFFIREAIYYTFDPSTNKYTYNNGQFALLGIHIIHKTQAYPDFIITSFEQKDLAKIGFSYTLLAPAPPSYTGSNFNPHKVKFPPVPPALPGLQVGGKFPISRQTSNPTRDGQLYPIPAQFASVNTQAQSQLKAANSIWANYQLIGVQADITEGYSPERVPNPSDPNTGTGPNHFMANHVIESDAFLGNFFGQGFGNNNFMNGDNIYYPVNTTGGAQTGKSYNMGGCKGCHGVAQTSFGTDFSFLLDFGANKPVGLPDTSTYVDPAKVQTASGQVDASITKP